MAILGLGILLAGGLGLVAVARRRSSRDDVLAEGIAGSPGGPGYPRPVPMPGHAHQVIEDPLVAAMARTSADRLGDGTGWKPVTARDADGHASSGPLWVRRLDAKMPVLPAAALADRVGRADQNHADRDADEAATQSA